MEREPGPVELIRPEQIPRVRPFDPFFETLQAPTSAALAVGEQLVAESRNELVRHSDGDPGGEFESIVGPAIGEIGAQLGSLGDVDVDGPLIAAEETAGEIDGFNTRLPHPERPPQLGPVDGEGGDKPGEVEWQEREPGGRPPEV